MSQVALDVVKEGVNADSFNDDDQLLQRLTDAAEAAISLYLRRDLKTEFSEGLPPDLEQAVIETVRWLFDGDASGETDRLPGSARALLSSYRAFT